MRRFRLWLLRMREARLQDSILRTRQLVLEDRARLLIAHAELRRVRSEIAVLTPASRLLKEAMGRRDAELANRGRIAWGDERGAGTAHAALASRQHHVHH